MCSCIRAFLVSLAIVSFCLSSLVALAKDDAVRVVIVLDASGSMWGKVSGRPKIEIARETIAGLMKDWDPAIELGLVAYGHRRESDCKDIELLVPVSKADPARIVRTVNALQAKGKTPLSEAVKQAAETLDYRKTRATVILVSDGMESCGADPCAVGAALKKAGADFVTHVVGFDVKKEEQAGLVCLAKNTGGMFLAAKDAAELKAALVTAVKQAKQTPNVTITAVPAKGAKPFETTDYVRIYPLGPDGKPAQKQVAGDYGNPTRFSLPAGRYRAEVKVGEGVATAEFEVKPEKTTDLIVIVGVGKVRITALPKPGAQPFKTTDYVRIFPLKPDGKPAEKQITGSYGNPTRFTLPAGRYQARVKVGEGVATAEFEVKPEKTTELTVIVGVGEVRITTFPKPGAQPFKTTSYVSIYPLGPDGKPAPNPLTRNYGNPTRFTLPAGRYQAEVKVGEGSTRANFEVQPEKITELTVVVGVATVRLTFVPKKGAAPFPTTDYVRIYPIGADGKPATKQITGNYGNPVTFTLPAGRYQVSAKVKENLSPSEIEVKAGEDRNIEIVVPKP